MTNEEVLYRSVIRPLYQDLIEERFVEDKSGVRLVELLNSNIILNPLHAYLEFPARRTPSKYVKAELEWYNSQSLSVNSKVLTDDKSISDFASIWKHVCSETGFINSNYGWCIYSHENGDQYYNVVDELRANPASRRATMIYNRPGMWYDYNRNGMDDFICTFATQHFIRNGKLITIVLMRSNDFIYGFFNDFYWQCHVHQKLVKDLGVKSGHMAWQANSMHIYERHFELLERLATNRE